MKSILGGSAIAVIALLLGFLIFLPRQSFGETLLTLQQQKQEPTVIQKQGLAADSSASAEVALNPSASSPDRLAGTVSETSKSNSQPAETTELSAVPVPVVPPTHYVATAYSLRGRTASGKIVARGLIAADPGFLPLGSRVRLEAGAYSGEYFVADTGGAVRGKRIDIWTASTREARRFGRRSVKLTVLSFGPKRVRVRRETQK